ncbi:MAG: zinc-binding dehydrogenase [Crocinitomicaceae bacterium]|jgi:NADPH2:quinone reductase|nr:zinc-binding dehydrogenase [Crocinitomicaceae bacterium]
MKSEALVLQKNKKGAQAFLRQEWSLPELQSTQVLIESEAFGLNYADVMASNGLYREAPPRPCVIGYEVVGKIVQVGSDLSEDLIGQRVLAFCRFGGYSKHVITEEYAFTLIDETADAGFMLALCTQGVTAYYMAHYLSPIRQGERVLIHAAAGGVGSLLIQMAKNAGAIVYAKIGSSKKADFVKKLGADQVIDYSKGDYFQQVNQLLGKERLDISYNPVAGDSFKKDFQLLGSGGRLFLFGGSQLSSGKWGLLSALNFLRKMGRPLPIGYMMRSKSVLGVNMLKIADFKPNVLRSCLVNVVRLTEEGKLHPQVGGTFKVGEFTEAFNLLADGKSTGKVVVKWD